MSEPVQLERFTYADGRVGWEWLVPVLDDVGGRVAWREPTEAELLALRARLGSA